MRINWKQLRWSLSVALIALIVLASTVVAQGTIPTSRFTRIATRYLTVSLTSAFTGNVTAAADVTVGDDLTTNDLITTDYEVVSPQPVLTLVMNGWITPTGTFQPVRSAAAVNISGARIAPGVANGQLLRLFNIGAQTVVITETLTSGVGLISAGNRTVGPGDTLTLVYSGTTWIQTGNSDN